MNYPSVRTLTELTKRYTHATMTPHEAAKLIRWIIKDAGTCELTEAWSTRPEFTQLRQSASMGKARDWAYIPMHGFGKHDLLAMDLCNELLGLHGVEGVSAGRNAKSPAFEYLNAGDSYAITLLLVHGRRYRVGCWGDMVERGDYE